MSKGGILRVLVNERLAAAAEEIFALVEKTILEYEEELSRSREENQRKQKLLDYVLNPQVLVHRVEVQTHVSSLPEPNVKKKRSPEIPQVKAEPEEHIEAEKSPKFPVCMNNEEQSHFPQQEKREKSPELSIKIEEQSYSIQEMQNGHEEITKENGNGGISSDLPGHLDSLSMEHTNNNENWVTPALHEDYNNVVQRRYFSAVAHNSAQFMNNNATPESSATVTNGNMFETDGRGRKRTFQCVICQLKCSTERALVKHIRLHTGEDNKTCSVCGKTFSQPNHLKIHMRTHTGERPYSCSICHKTFVQKCTLDVHWRTHTGERPFSCPFCHKSFIDGSSRRKHVRIHTGERPYSCSFCAKRFKSCSALKSHRQSQHLAQAGQL